MFSLVNNLDCQCKLFTNTQSLQNYTERRRYSLLAMFIETDYNFQKSQSIRLMPNMHQTKTPNQQPSIFTSSNQSTSNYQSTVHKNIFQYNRTFKCMSSFECRWISFLKIFLVSDWCEGAALSSILVHRWETDGQNDNPGLRWNWENIQWNLELWPRWKYRIIHKSWW